MNENNEGQIETALQKDILAGEQMVLNCEGCSCRAAGTIRAH